MDLLPSIQFLLLSRISQAVNPHVWWS